MIKLILIIILTNFSVQAQLNPKVVQDTVVVHFESKVNKKNIDRYLNKFFKYRNSKIWIHDTINGRAFKYAIRDTSFHFQFYDSKNKLRQEGKHEFNDTITVYNKKGMPKYTYSDGMITDTLGTDHCDCIMNRPVQLFKNGELYKSFRFYTIGDEIDVKMVRVEYYYKNGVKRKEIKSVCKYWWVDNPNHKCFKTKEKRTYDLNGKITKTKRKPNNT